MNKKFTCLFIGLLLLCGLRSSAQVTFNISPESISAEVNDAVSVDVTVADFDAVMIAQFAIGWDENVLEFQSVSNLNADLPSLTSSNLGVPGSGNVAPNRVFLSWNHPNFNNAQLADDAVLFTINLTAKAEGQTSFEFVDDQPGIEIVNQSGQNLGFNSDSRTTVTVGSGSGGGSGGGGSGGGNSDCDITGLGIQLSDAAGSQGEEITIDVVVQGFQAISGMQYTIDYNPAVLQYDGIANINLTGLSEVGNFSNSTAGKIIVTWNDPQATGVTLADETVIYSITFTVLQDTPTTVSLSDDPRKIEFLQEQDGNSQPIASGSCESTVNEGSTGGGNNGGGNTECNFTGFGLKFAAVSAAQGEQICMDVTVQDFVDILGMQYTLNYDPAVLQFQSIINTNLSGLTAGGNFGNPTPGKITVFWFDQSVAGVTLDNDTRIYSICFTVLQETPTTITLGDTPTAIEFSSLNSSEAIDYSICEGSVNGGGNTGGGGNNCTLSGFGLDLGSVNAPQGSQACLDFKVQDFDLITGMQFTLDYDPSILEYVSVSNIDLPDMSAAGNFGNPSPGKITVFWFHQATTGVTKADDSVIFTVCFNVLQPTGTTINLGDTPTVIEFSKFGETTAISYDICPGLVNMVTSEPPVIASAEVIPTSCNTTEDGSVSLTIDGEGTYSYQWSRGTGTGNTVTGLSSGPVSVTVTDTESGLTVNGTYDITSPSAVTVNANIVQVSCIGENNGSIVITASGGTGNLTYSWAPGGSTNSTLNNLAPGSYGLTITDENNCSTEFGPYEITEPSADITISETIVDVTCPADITGSISVDISGGTPNYRLDWSGSLLDNVLIQNGLPAGTYGLTVTDARNCSKIVEFTVKSTNPAIQISAVPVNIPDGGAGAVNITATGGSGAFTYNWSGPSNFSSDTEDLIGLSAPGEYCVTVTDAAGCTESICVTIGRELIITDFSISQPCDGGANGSIDITVQGGVTPYTYEWKTSGSSEVLATTEDLVGIAAGIYNLTVTDANNETVSGSFEATGTTLQIEAAITPTAPDVNSGAIELDVPGDPGTYTVQWSNGSTTDNIANLAIGEYCVTVTFTGGCTFEECYQVTDEPFSIISLDQSDLSCAGNQDGSISLQVKGGIKPYSLNMAGESYSSNTGSFLVDGLAAGTFDLVVMDAGGASENRQVIIEEPAPIVYEAIVVHDTEDSGCTGSITLQLSGGKAPYSVNWNGQGLVGQQIIVCGFEYTATIVDSEGCTFSTDPIMVTTFSEAAQITDVSCPGEENAIIDLTIDGGDTSQPYTFAWRETPGGPVISTAEDLEKVGEGTYYVEISEASGNKLNREYTVKTTSGLTVRASVETDYNGFGVSCSDAADGSLAAVVTNAAGMVEYEWLMGGSVVGSSAILNNAAGGDYILRIIDDNCISEIPASLPAPAELKIETLNIRNVACEGERDGAISILATGGTAPYIYRWSNNDFGSEIDFLAAGEYTATVTDRNNCMIVQSFRVGDPSPLQVTIMTEPATNEMGMDCNGSVRAMVTGGQEPYQYRWVNINNSAENMVLDLCPGEYIVEVTDALGCLPVQASGFVRDRTQPCFSTRTVITPDGDGLNEDFIIFCADEYPNNLLKIYNRWGQLVYERNNYNCTQNGGDCFNGRNTREEPLPEGAYFWVLEYTDNASGEEVQLRGSLTILSSD